MASSTYIKASAGTGKTYTITEEIVPDLIKNGTTLDRILIVTYTEKATGELRHRIREVLNKNASDPNCKAALQMVDNAPIHTIHSFCQHILGELAFEAGESVAPTLISDGDISTLIEDKIRGDWANNLQNIDPDGLRETFISAIQSYYNGVVLKVSPVILLAEQFSKANDDIDLMQISGMAQLIKDIQNDITASSNSTVQKKLNDLQTWKNGDEFFKNVGSVKFYDQVLWERVEQYKKASTENSFEKDLFVVNNLPALAEEWKSYKIAHNLQSYNDMIDRVREKVTHTQDTSFLEALRAKFDCAIIDEFQDTNQRQWDIFKKIFLESSNHSVIVVGDEKQSIFAFQGADVRVYNEAIEEIKTKGGVQKTLDTNYRATAPMIEATNALFNCSIFQKALNFNDSKVPQNNNRATPQYKGKAVGPLLIPQPQSEEERVDWKGQTLEEYAELVAKKIMEFATYDNGKTNLQIFDKDNPAKLRNVSFKDFAILCRTRSECTDIEAALHNYNIPFLKYKDNNLFASSECAEWIALFQSINQADFNGEKRKFLNEVCLTDFLRTKKEEEAINLILEWRKLACSGKFAAMLESIYEKSSIKEVLHTVKKISNLGLLQQIGDYAVNYLYRKNTSIDSLVKHLNNLKNNEESVEDDNGNIVQKCSDFDAVQILTIHASKGLEFPIVISVIGNKQFYDSSSNQAFIFHDGNKLCMGFDKFAKAENKKETLEEWKRLFYVAYTRASSLLILPVYEKWRDKKGNVKEEFACLWEAFCSINTKINGHYQTLAIEPEHENWSLADWQKLVADTLSKTKADDSKSTSDDAPADLIAQLNSEMSSKIRRQHSYSSLQNHNQTAELTLENGRSVDGSNQDIDEEETNEASTVINEPDGFPRGANLGNALHDTMEDLCNGVNGLCFSTMSCTQQAAEQTPDLLSLIEKNFLNNGIKNRDVNKFTEWIKHSAGIVWRTLNANLDNNFQLKDLQIGDAVAEMEFYMDSSEQNIDAFCKGFIDLFFKKDEKYWLLDWKSDRMDSYDTDAVEAQVEIRYDVQRVLYPYVAIKWLANILNKTEEEVFAEDFGGIYYVFLRGTKEVGNQGWCLKTWDSYQTLIGEYHEKVGKKIFAMSQN